LDGLFLQTEVRGNPHGVVGVPDGGKDHAALSKIVGPTSDRFGSQVRKSQAVDIFGFEQDMLTIFVVFDVVLLIVHDERLDPLGDGVVFVDNVHFEGPQLRGSSWTTKIRGYCCATNKSHFHS